MAVGGPFASSTPDAPELELADFKVLDEGEITLPLFIEAIERGEKSGRFSANGDKPDVTGTPIPRFDLLELDAYDSMSVQFSRGCPFQCEFCDIIVLYGRKPRTKTPEQLIAELQYLYDLGWRRSIFLVDDNFIGNKRNAKLLLPALKQWQIERAIPSLRHRGLGGSRLRRGADADDGRMPLRFGVPRHRNARRGEPLDRRQAPEHPQFPGGIRRPDHLLRHPGDGGLHHRLRRREERSR